MIETRIFVLYNFVLYNFHKNSTTFTRILNNQRKALLHTTIEQLQIYMQKLPSIQETFPLTIAHQTQP